MFDYHLVMHFHTLYTILHEILNVEVFPIISIVQLGFVNMTCYKMAFRLFSEIPTSIQILKIFCQIYVITF